MFYSFIYFFCLLSSAFFIIMKHPLSMGLMLLLQTFLICMIMGTLMKSFWFSYILFLIFIGGMMVLFIYVISLASNEIFNFSSKMFFLFIFIINFILILILFMDKTFMISYMKNIESTSILFQKTFLSENSFLMNKLYNFPTNLISIMLMIYLFFTLVAIVKITNIFEGPLRQKF